MPGLESRQATLWYLVAIALVLAVFLVGTALWGFRNASAMADTANVGQAELFMRTLRQTTDRSDGSVTQEALDEYVSSHWDLGVRYAAILGARGPVLAAGEPSSPLGDPSIPTLGQAGLMRIGERCRAISKGPPPPRLSTGSEGPGRPRSHDRRREEEGRHDDDGPERPRLDDFQPPTGVGPLLEQQSRPDVEDGLGQGPGAPPEHRPEDWRGPKGPPGRHRGPPPMMVLEFVPILTESLTAGAGVALLVAIIASLALMGAVLIFWRLLVRAGVAEAELEHQRRLAMLGEMSAVLAHEIRNPLAALKGHAQLLAEATAGEEREGRNVQRVVDGAIRLEELCNDLLDFARARDLNRRLCSPAALLRESAEAAHAGESTDGPQIEIDARSAPEEWSLDPVRLQRALANILRNAVQASAGARVLARVAIEGGNLLFVIRDSGGGIPTDQQERIFEPFHTKRSRGVGLGLTVARQVVEMHGGTIGVANRPGSGAEFRIEIPST